MQLGIIGVPGDSRVDTLERFLHAQQCDVIVVNSRSFSAQESWAFDGEHTWYRGQNLSRARAWCLFTYPPSFPNMWTDFENYFLYRDWYEDYMHKREHRSFLVAWLLALGHRGVPVLNPPEHGIGLQYKPVELELARQEGLKTPRTLITNDPERVRAFAAEVPEVVYKPAFGGSECRVLGEKEMAQLELLKASPVTFQECIRGKSIRVMVVDGKVVSAVRLMSDYLDYRSDPDYSAGKTPYETVELPERLLNAAVRVIERYGLYFSGIDFIETAEGEYVFLEANASPMYMDIESRAQHPITAELCAALLKYANGPEAYAEALQKRRHRQGFASYAMPGLDNVWT